MSPNEVIKGLAKPFVICRQTPSSMAKMKNMAMRGLRKSLKALSPRASANDFWAASFLIGIRGMVNE